MEKIEILLQKLNGKIPVSLADRVDELDELIEKSELAGNDYEKNPTDENRINYNEIIDYVEEIQLGLEKDLSALLKQIQSEELAKNKQATQPSTQSTTTPKSSEEKKEGFGVLTLVIGGALLIASFGAINYFRKQ